MKTRSESRFQFQCPKCGGCHFSSSDYDGEKIWCHDEFNHGCKFKDDNREDWKYFIYREETRTYFKNKEEYEKFRKEKK